MIDLTQATQLAPHFTLEEACFSETATRLGIGNIPPDSVLPALRNTARSMEVVRTLLGAPILVNSWYRSLALNTALKSPRSSQHIKGEAVDFRAPVFGSPRKICEYLLTMETRVRWHQLILEHTWVHISWISIPGAHQSGQVLSLLSNGGYATGLTDSRGVAFPPDSLV